MFIILGIYVLRNTTFRKMYVAVIKHHAKHTVEPLTKSHSQSLYIEISYQQSVYC
jgi:hypothetical protein